MGQSQATLKAKAAAERAERDRVTADGKLVLESFEKYVKAVDAYLEHTRSLQRAADVVNVTKKQVVSELADTPKDLDDVKNESRTDPDAMRKEVEDAIQKKHEATMRERKQFETHYSQSGLGMTTFYNDSAKPEEMTRVAWTEATTVRYIDPPDHHNKTLFSTP